MTLTAPPPTKVFPFMSQIEVRPLVFRKRMSEPPSYQAPKACQLGPGLDMGTWAIMLVPFISQVETWPLLVF